MIATDRGNELLTSECIPAAAPEVTTLLPSQEDVTTPGDTATVGLRLKILHLNNEKTWRGGERQTLLLARALQGCGVETAIACRPNAPLGGYARQQGVPTLPLAANPFGALVDLGRAASRYDLVHCHTARTHSLATLTAGWSRKPVLVTRRVDFAVPPTWFNRYKYLLASRVVCVSAHIANQLRDWGVPAAKLVVVRDAVPLRPLATADQMRALRVELQVPVGMKVVGNIAALVGHKDHATLLRAARAVTRQRTDVMFLIIGDGDLRDDLQRQQHELGLDDSVRFLGFLPEAERLLPAFDIFVMSSHMEGLGSIVLDAFAADVPVAATAAGDCRNWSRTVKPGCWCRWEKPTDWPEPLAGSWTNRR